MNLNKATSKEIIQYCFENKITTLEGLGTTQGFTRERARQILSNKGVPSTLLRDIKNYFKFIEFKKNNPDYNPSGNVWKPVKDYPELEVSDKGLVRTLKTKYFGSVGYRWCKERNINTPLTTKGSNTTYSRISISKDGEPNTIYVHRLVAEAFIDNPDNKPCVNHLDGDGTNNNVSNLEWCTYRENTIHSLDWLDNNHIRWDKSRTYLVTSPVGESFKVNNLKEWCLSEGFVYEHFARACRSGSTTSGGWTITRINKEDYEQMS